MIKIQYQLTEDDFVDAHFAHMRNRYGMLGVIPPPVLSTVMFVVALAIVVCLMVAKKDSPVSWLFVSVGAFVLFPLGILSYLWSGIPFRSQFRKTKSLQAPGQIEIDDEGITYTTADSQGKTHWTYFEKWRESQQAFLLYFQKAMFFIVPKKLLLSEDVPALRELLKNKIR